MKANEMPGDSQWHLLKYDARGQVSGMNEVRRYPERLEVIGYRILEGIWEFCKYMFVPQWGRKGRYAQNLKKI